MGGEVSFEVDLPGVDGTSYGTGIFAGNKTLEIAYIDVKDNSRIPRGRYEVPRTKITAIEAILDLDTLVENPDGSVSARSVDEPDEVELTKAQIDALAQYTDASYWNINKHLREGAPLTEDDVKDLETLLSLINKSSISQDKILYRGRAIKSQERLNAINALKPGDAITDRGIMSTSASSNRANFYAEMNLDDVLGRIMFEIEAKAGQKAFEVPDQYSSYGSSESEVLLPPNSRLEVVEVLAPVDGIKTIRLRLVDQVEVTPAPSTDVSGVIDVVDQKSVEERIEPGLENWMPTLFDFLDVLDSEDEDEGQERVSDNTRGNLLHSMFLEAAGFNGKPKLSTQEEFDAIEGEKIYRAVTNRGFVEDYLTSEIQYAGEGSFGNGTYTTNRRETTEYYAGDTNGDQKIIDGRTMEIKLAPDSNVLSFEEVPDMREWANTQAAELHGIAEQLGANPQQLQSIDWQIINDSDWTNIAIMLGYDAVRFKVPMTENDEYYTIIFNRGKVVVNGKS
jgi:hypothetical protein